MSEVRVIRAADLSTQTSQTPGMHRATAVSGETAGSKTLWVGRVTLLPSARSGPHHHGNCESVICVTAGRIRLRYGDRLQDSMRPVPGTISTSRRASSTRRSTLAPANPSTQSSSATPR